MNASYDGEFDRVHNGPDEDEAFWPPLETEAQQRARVVEQRAALRAAFPDGAADWFMWETQVLDLGDLADRTMLPKEDA